MDVEEGEVGIPRATAEAGYVFLVDVFWYDSMAWVYIWIHARTLPYLDLKQVINASVGEIIGGLNKPSS